MFIVTGVYTQRDPRKTDLYKILDQYFDEFKRVYPERFEESYGPWRSEIEEAVRGYLNCGIFDTGFAKIYCPECDSYYVLPFSCKKYTLCPSCQEKRSLWWSEWLCEEVAQEVAHRQYVFTIPHVLRGFFRRNRYLLKELSRVAWESVKEFFQILCPQAGEDAVAGGVSCPQTCGNLLNWHPHIHMLITDGLFANDGTFYSLPELTSEELDDLTRLFRAKVINMLRDKALLSEELANKILSWRHNSGFSVHNKVRIEAGDREGLERVARYIIRSPVS